MTTNEITSQDIAAWMLAQLAKAHEMSDYASVEVRTNQFRGYEPVVKFRVCFGGDKMSGEYESIAQCFADLERFTPEFIAAKKREAAAKLLAEADEILAKATTI